MITLCEVQLVRGSLFLYHPGKYDLKRSETP
jgi:hypothetical protein